MWADGGIFENWLRFAGDRGIAAYAINLRGHADSFPVEIGSVSTADCVADLKVFIDKIGKCVLVGHSSGGLIAQKTASEDPRVRGAVFVATAPPRWILPEGEILWRMLRPEYLSAAFSNRPFKLRFDDACATNLSQVKEREKVFERFIPDSGRMAREMGFLGVAVDPKKIVCPTMVIGGRHDRMIPPEVQRAVAKKYCSRYEEFPTGHLPMLEPGWREVIRRSIDFSAGCI
ncbi:alpha/beta hydrolase [Candidatus Giovannonibacteria bacterium]|nr:alpha/beta hydrolase [Candidatus Giovannonibacteria bacterium]